MNPVKYEKYSLIAGLTLCLLINSNLSYSQCGAAPIAATTCSGGNGAATDGVNINSGNTYWFSGGPAIFSSINLNGGTLRICGSLILGSLNYNSGTLIIESGGSLTVASMSSLNGSTTIINRGSLTISGGFTMQNANNYIYNDLTTSVMTISGTLMVNSSTSYIINRGIITVSSLYLQGPAGSVCVQNNSITNIGVLTNETLNSFIYSGNGVAACVNVSSSAKLDADLTSFSTVNICKGSAVTMSGGALAHTGGGWGSATVHTGCSSCATILTLSLLSFTAREQTEGIRLQWTIGEEPTDGTLFYAERSSDGSDFHAFSSVTAITGQSSYSVLDADITNAVQYYRIKTILPTGASFYSPIAAVETGTTGQLTIYPNPVRPDGTVNMLISTTMAGTARLSVLNVAGQELRVRNATLTRGSNQLSWNVGQLSAGIYWIRLNLPGEKRLYGRISVLN